MISEEKQDKFDEVVELLRKEYDASSPIVNGIIEMVMVDVFKDYPTDHLGTFAEFKHIDEFNALLLSDNVINRSSCGRSTYDIQEVIKKDKEEENV